MAFVENFAPFMADFATDCIVGGQAVLGIFDDAYADPLGVSGSTPVLRLPTASVGSASFGDSVTVGATSYTIAGMEPDGTGLTRLRLQEV